MAKKTLLKTKKMVSFMLILSLCFVPLLLQVQPAKAAMAFSSGFEDNFNSWSWKNGNAAIISSPVYGGVKAASFHSASGGDQNCAVKDLGADYSHLYVSGWFNFPSLPTTVPYNFVALIGLHNSAWQSTPGYFVLAYNPQSQRYYFGMYNPVSNSYTNSADLTLLPNTWYYLSIEVAIGQSGTMNAWINQAGSQPSQIINFVGNTGSSLIRYVFVGMDYTWNLQGLPGGLTVYLDDVTISESPPSSSGPSRFKVGLFTTSWNFKEYSSSTIASTFDLTYSWWISPSDTYNQYGSKMNQVLALNPDFKPLVYRQVEAIYDYWPDEFNYAMSQGWLLKDANGNYLHGAEGFSDEYVVDMTNPAYQAWVAQKVESWLVQYPFFAGVFVDGGLKYSVDEWAARAGTPINPRTGLPFTTQQILDGCVGTLNAITNAVGPSKIVVANGIWSGFLFNDPTYGANYKYILSQTPNLSGINSEGTFYQSYNPNYWPTDWWQASVDMTTWIQDNFLSKGSNRQFISMFPVMSLPIPSGTTQKDLAMFGFCSLMLGAKYSAQNSFSLGDLSKDPAMLSFAQQLRNLNLGEPLANYYKLNSVYLYVREFQAGKVVVNPSSTPYVYSLDTTYRLIDGTTVSGAITINAHNGVILLK